MLHSLPKQASGKELPSNCSWIDLIDPSNAELDLIRDRFGIEVPTLADLEKIEASSRLRARDDTLFMSAPLLSGTGTNRWKLAPVGFILTPMVCITVRFVKLDAFDDVAKDLGDDAAVTPAEIFTRLLEEIVDRAADHLERASGVVDDTSQSVFFEEPKRRQLSKDTALLRDAMRTIGQVSDRTSRVRYTFLRGCVRTVV